ncbi:histidine phosphatase family protein [Kaarinaea lacus]
MPIWFMRHGETNYNQLGLCNDDPRDDVHLSSQGIVQAEAAAEKLKSFPIREIIVSQLPRTRQTAEIINRYHHTEIRACEEINDIRSGFNNLPVADYFLAIADAPLTKRVNGGESLLDHKQRIENFLIDLRNKNTDAVLVVAHEETLRVVTSWFENLPAEKMRDLHFANCEVLEYDWS